jgi:hypothetical protein
VSEIPASLAPFFQEYDLEQLTLERSATTIIERTLQYGNREEIHWLFSQYSRQRIREWVQKWGKQALPEPHLTFWRLVLDIPESGRFYSYGYSMVRDLIETEGVRLASIEDIGLMKLVALLGRASRKDFHDLYAICQRIPLRGLLDSAPQKYPNVRDFEAQVVRRLAYFEHAEQEEPVPLLQDVPWETVKSYFREQAIRLGKD